MAFRWVVMIEKWRAPSIIRKAISRQLASTTASETLQPSSFALATPAASILRLAASVSLYVLTISDIAPPPVGTFRRPRERGDPYAPNCQVIKSDKSRH